MKEMPTDDPLFGKGTIRADGRKLHPAYLFEVKKPAESKYPGDFYKLQRHDPGGRSVPPAQGRRLPAGQRLIAVTAEHRDEPGAGSHGAAPASRRKS